MIPLLWASSLLTGCGVGQSHPSQVTDTQVIAVVTEPPVPAPGDTVFGRIYVADPEERGVVLMAWTCTPLGDQPCLELAGGIHQLVTVLEPRPDGVYTLSRSIPSELAAYADAEGRLSAALWVLACPPETCDIIQQARQALANPQNSQLGEALAEDLADPRPWMEALPMKGVNLAVQPLTLSTTDRFINSNPVAYQRFVATSEPVESFVAPVAEATDLRFAVTDPDGRRVDAWAFTTVGRFQDDKVREDDRNDTVVHWLLAPTRPTRGRVWVVFDDRDGGRDVFTAEVVVE